MYDTLVSCLKQNLYETVAGQIVLEMKVGGSGEKKLSQEATFKCIHASLYQTNQSEKTSHTMFVSYPSSSSAEINATIQLHISRDSSVESNVCLQPNPPINQCAVLSCSVSIYPAIAKLTADWKTFF